MFYCQHWISEYWTVSPRGASTLVVFVLFCFLISLFTFISHCYVYGAEDVFSARTYISAGSTNILCYVMSRSNFFISTKFMPQEPWGHWAQEMGRLLSHIDQDFSTDPDTSHLCHWQILICYHLFDCSYLVSKNWDNNAYEILWGLNKMIAVKYLL